MRKHIPGIFALAVLCLFVAPSAAQAQTAYGSSRISYDSVTKRVYGYSRTWLDASAGAYYDPYVEGFLYNEFNNYPLAAGGNRGYENWTAAEVRTGAYTTPSTRYDVISDHYVISWYSVTVTVCGYYSFYGDSCGYDPYGFSFMGGWYGGFGNFFSPGYGGYVYGRTYYLGSTGISGVTPPPDSCPVSYAMSADASAAQSPTEYEYSATSESYRDNYYFASSTDACPNPTPTPAPIAAQVTEVGFKGDYTVLRFAKGDVNKQTAYDPDDRTPTWKKDKNPNAPVAYKMGQQPTMFATLTLSPAPPSPVSARIQVKRGTTVIAVKDVTLSGANARIDDIAVTAALENPAKVKRGDYKFTWEISFDNGSTWKPMGSSSHEIHWLYAEPIPTPFVNAFNRPYNGLFDEALKHSTGEMGDGSSNLDEIIRKINEEVSDDIEYHPEKPAVDQHPLRYFSNRYAVCQENALVLRGLLRSIGIDAAAVYYWGGNPATGEQYTYVWSGNHPSFQVKRPKEDDIEPDPHFSYHAMVRPVGSATLYDPSYGLTATRVDFIEVFDKPANTFRSGADASRPFVVERPTLNPTEVPTNRECPHSVHTPTLFPNPIDNARNFVAQHYYDLLGREPDQGGLDWWTSQITNCGTDAACVERQRVNVSLAFFLSREFQQTGLFTYYLYRLSYGRQPQYFEFLTGQANVGRGYVDGTPGADAVLEANQTSYLDEWMQADDFREVFDDLSNEQYVDKLYANAGVTPSASERQGLIDALNSGSQTRGGALRSVMNNATFRANEDHPAFVLMEYFGFLRRNPYDPPDSDMGGYNWWLGQYNSHNNQFEMVKAFIQSTEFRSRFGQP